MLRWRSVLVGIALEGMAGTSSVVTNGSSKRKRLPWPGDDLGGHADARITDAIDPAS